MVLWLAERLWADLLTVFITFIMTSIQAVFSCRVRVSLLE